MIQRNSICNGCKWDNFGLTPKCEKCLDDSSNNYINYSPKTNADYIRMADNKELAIELITGCYRNGVRLSFYELVNWLGEEYDNQTN